jgi:hypothetical protein
MLISAYDPLEASRSVELQAGDLFEEGIRADLLVISAKPNFYEPEPGSMVAALRNQCRLEVGKLKRELDLTGTPTINSWVSASLEEQEIPPQWPEGSATRFQRLVVIESDGNPPVDGAHWPLFQQLFCLLALLPLHGICYRSVAAPLLGTGRQGADPSQLFPSLLDGLDSGFQHVPGMERLVIFDRKRDALEQLAGQINGKIRQTTGSQRQLSLNQLQTEVNTLRKEATRAMQLKRNQDAVAHIQEFLHQIQSADLNSVTLGVSARTLIENLIQSQTNDSRAKIYNGINELSRSGRISRWTASCLHQVRSFGNWMAHATEPDDGSSEPRHGVKEEDVAAVIMSLIRILRDYPWTLGRKAATRPPRIPAAYRGW